MFACDLAKQKSQNESEISDGIVEWLPEIRFLRTLLKVSPLFQLLPEGYRLTHSWNEEMKQIRAKSQEQEGKTETLALKKRI